MSRERRENVKTLMLKPWRGLSTGSEGVHGNPVVNPSDDWHLLSTYLQQV